MPGTVGNWEWPFLHEGSHEITLTVPLTPKMWEGGGINPQLSNNLTSPICKGIFQNKKKINTYFCHNSYNLATCFSRPLICQNINSGWSNSFILFRYLATYMYFNSLLYNALKIEPRIGKRIFYTFLKCDMTRGYIYYIQYQCECTLFLTIGLKRFKSNLFFVHDIFFQKW